MLRLPLLLLIACLFLHCQSPDSGQQADLILYNGPIYTLNDDAPTAEAIVVQENRIIFVGSEIEAMAWKGSQTNLIDLAGKTLTPGFIEGHGHFMGLGQSQLNLNLSTASSFAEIVAMVKQAAAEALPGEWIQGRGWHQDKWTDQPNKQIKGFPVHDALSQAAPDNPVYLRHASGHAGIANAMAMEVADITAASEFDETGEIIKDEQGNPTGIFNEEAETLIKHLPAFTEEMQLRALKLAMEACLANGITSFHDAGVGESTLSLYQSLQAANDLQVRLYVMLDGKSTDLLENWYTQGPAIDNWLTVRSIKLYADGALGSRGALLLKPYEDEVHPTTGNPDMDPAVVEAIASAALTHGFQVGTHAIGDRANREVLDAYEAAFAQHTDVTDPRFRIEHAQHLHPDDIPRFGEMGIIAAMQGIHMASDRPWAIDRLGQQRIIDGAYVWQKLLNTGATIINGTDTPVEPVNPIACFYASVTRQTLTGNPPGGYEGDQKMTREQALRSYTLDAAFAAFEEAQKGSIEIGKLADFTVFNQDIMTVPDSALLNTQVALTIIDGKIAYKGE